MISIVFPHANNEENNKVLELKLRLYKKYTTCEYEILYMSNDKRPDLVYPFWDWAIRNAKYDLILWDNTDLLPAPKWNENVLAHKDDADWIGIQLVECGQIGVHSNNIHKNFGITAKEVEDNIDLWEKWVEDESKNKGTKLRDGFCWYSPSVWKKEWYIKMGGFDLSKSFPYPNDSEFREKCEREVTKFIVVNSYFYHLQRAGENLGNKLERV